MPGRTPSPGTAGLSSEPSYSICMPMQMPRNGRPDAAHSMASSSSPVRSSASMQRPKLPTPGSTTPAASRISPGSAVSRASAPMCSSAFCAEWRLPMP